jgi:cold-inducible RNA-binding protein
MLVTAETVRKGNWNRMSQKLYVGNLSYNTTEGTLRTLFAEFGEIESVNLITDRDTGRPKGFAFVEMSTEQAAQKSISSLNGKMVDDREIKVDRAKPQADRERRPSSGRGPRW